MIKTTTELIAGREITEDISSVKNFEDLPKNAQTYIKAIEDFIEVPITFISVGPERTENIII